MLDTFQCVRTRGLAGLPLLCMALLCAGLPGGTLQARAQAPLPPEPPASARDLSPKALVAALGAPDSPGSAALLRRLGAADCCDDADAVTEKLLWARGDEQLVAVEATASTYVQVFTLYHDGGAWELAGLISLPAKYSTPAYRMQVMRGQPAIIVNNLTVDAGPGSQQQNTLVYFLIDRHLRVVFNQPEKLVFALGPEAAPPQGWHEEQQSTFDFVARGNETLIREVRNTTVNHTKVTLYREYAWSEGWKMFYVRADPPFSTMR